MTTEAERNMNERSADFKTICKECIFAEITGLTQTGCKLGRLEKFEDQGRTTLVNDEETGLQYYAIDTFCNACRAEMWARKYDDPLTEVLEEIAIQVDFIILVRRQGENGPANLRKTLESIVAAPNIHPRKIIVVVQDRNVNPSQLITTVSSVLTDSDGYNLIDNRLVTIFGDSTNETMIDECFKEVNSTFYAVFEAGYEVPLDYLEKLNQLLNYDMIQFSMVDTDEGINGFLVQRMLHKILYGNNTMPLREKIKLLAHEQDAQHMVKKMEPNVTIIIPHHNLLEYLEDAIKSAQSQTYDNIFICVIDNSSKDMQEEAHQLIGKVLFNGQACHHRNEGGIRVLSNANYMAIFMPEPCGPSQARNEGINRTIHNTQLYMNLDADDMMEPEKTQKFVDVFNMAPEGIGAVYADFYSVNTTTGKRTYDYKEPYNLQRLQRECIVHSGAGISAKALSLTADNFGFYDREMRTCEDYDLWMRISEKFMLVHIPEPLTTVRIQPRNSSVTVNKEIWQRNWQRVHQKAIHRAQTQQ